MLGPVQELLAKGRDSLPPVVQEELEVVNRNGRRLQRLVNRLLDFSRIEAGRMRAVYRPTDVSAFTADLVSVFRSACERAGLRMEVVVGPIGELVYIDREMWEKIVLNLLSNAFKFTFEGGITVTMKKRKDYAVLEVRDTGTGMPADEVPRLFERFYRVENARGRTHEGSGIGLALVHELVLLHGGTVSVESELNRGTAFRIQIPLGKAHLPQGQIEEHDLRGTIAYSALPYVEEAIRWLPDEQQDLKETSDELPRLHQLLRHRISLSQRT